VPWRLDRLGLRDTCRQCDVTRAVSRTSSAASLKARFITGYYGIWTDRSFSVVTARVARAAVFEHRTFFTGLTSLIFNLDYYSTES
jgi:hypothetical protein